MDVATTLLILNIAATAAIQGAATAAGTEAFQNLKRWIKNKLGSNSSLEQSIQALESKPTDLQTQEALRTTLLAHEAILTEPEFIKAMQAVQQNFQNTIYIGSQHAEKIVNAGNIDTLNM